jgi:muramoyltetrapeptide carboxypeptidase
VRLVLPAPLAPGDRIGIAAPGGPVRPAALEAGIAYLSARGYVPVRGRHLDGRHGYLAGSDSDRLEDVNGFLADPSIRAIWFARGGYGSARIVAGLRLAGLRQHPKVLIGYSDVTVIQAAALRRAGLATLYGPLVQELGSPEAFDEGSLWEAAEGGARAIEHRLEPAAVLRPGVGEGPLVGGCLSLLVSLIGTPYEPPTDGAILFWEEVNEEPYRIDRMLGHLRLAGRLRRLKGMLVGRPVGCRAQDPANDLPLSEILLSHLKSTRYPVVLDFPAGHCPGKVTLPLGRRARLDAPAHRLRIL